MSDVSRSESQEKVDAEGRAFMQNKAHENGLTREATTALAQLENNPQELDHARARFAITPPLRKTYSELSGTPIQYSSSLSLSPSAKEKAREEDIRFQRRLGLRTIHYASRPHNQVENQRSVEQQRIKIEECGLEKYEFFGGGIKKSREIFRARRIDQGIWDHGWDDTPLSWNHPWKWKHEDPLELDQQATTNADAASSAEATPFISLQETRRRVSNSNSNYTIIASHERQSLRTQESEASRPYHQFLYQLTKNREKIQEVLRISTGRVSQTLTREHMESSKTHGSRWRSGTKDGAYFSVCPGGMRSPLCSQHIWLSQRTYKMILLCLQRCNLWMATRLRTILNIMLLLQNISMETDIADFRLISWQHLVQWYQWRLLMSGWRKPLFKGLPLSCYHRQPRSYHLTHPCAEAREHNINRQ